MTSRLSPAHSKLGKLLFLFLLFSYFSTPQTTAQPINDDCDGIVDLGDAPVCPFPETFTNVEATLSEAFSTPADNIPSCFVGEPDRDVWFSFTVPASGTILDFQIEIEGVAGSNGSIEQPQVAIYRGDCFLDELVELACATSAAGENRVELDVTGLTPGLSYFLRVNDWSNSADPNWGDFEVCVKEPPLTPPDLPWAPDPVCESIITNGIAAVTCGILVETDPAERWTFGLLNIEEVLPAAGRQDVTADVEMYHHPSWHVDSIGNVFGVTMDYSGNTYIAASSNYGAGYFFNDGIIRYGEIGGGEESLEAAGTIYKIDGMSGQASVFAVLPQQVSSFENNNCEGATIVFRNTGPALGNVVFSPSTKQFYVTNFEDGRIYHLDENGNILESYDPFQLDNGLAGTPDLVELAYGLDVTADGSELFFGIVGFDGFSGSDLPGVYSIPLDPDGSFVGTVDNSTNPAGSTWNNLTGTEQLHIELPAVANTFTAEMLFISDLEFTPDGKLLVGIRVGCGNSIHNSYNHGGQALRLSLNSGTGLYDLNDGNIYTGFAGSIGGSSEAYGGVSVYETPDGDYQYTITSADILNEPGPHGLCILPEGVFGATGAPAAPAGAVNYGFDLFGQDPKGIGGDVKVFVACEVENFCAEANFTVSPTCGALTISPVNLSSNATAFEWYFNDPANPGLNSTDENPTFTYSDFGTYEIMLVASDDSLCTDTIMVMVTLSPNSLTADFDVQVVQCSDSISVIFADLSTDSISTITSWSWVFETIVNTYTSDEQNPTFVISETGSATLTLTITNANGCAATFTDEVLLKNMPLSLDLGPDLNICGTQTIELDAGPGFTEYLWSTAETTQSITINSSGTYSVSATDACGETQTDEVIVSLDTVGLDLPEMVEICRGESYTFDVSGFETYQWTPTDFLSCSDCPNPTATPTETITYTLTAITADDCEAMASTEVVVLPTFETSLEFDVCEGETIVYEGEILAPGSVTEFEFITSNGCDSTVTVSVFGLPNFAEDLSLSACAGETVTYNGTELSPGSVTDFSFVASNGCDSVVTVTVIELPNVETSESISICSGETADIFGTPTGTAGVYEMTFPSSLGCDSTHTITLSVFEAIVAQATGTDVSCFGGADGTASASATGGTAPYVFTWSTGESGPSVADLEAGIYSVTATDVNGCTGETSVTIGQPTEVVVTASGQNVSCDELGSASANATGGTPGYAYEWSTGATTADITDLEAGTYTVTATDLNGCSAEASVEITGALGPDVSISIDQLPSEDEPESGALTAEIVGGTAPFQVEWSNGESTLSIDSLPSGEYIVTITDANGCTATDVAYIYLPGCTGGKIWNDTNRDGCQMGGELGIGGIELELMGTDIWGNDISLTTVTAINGEYIFEPLPPGDYQVFLPVPPGYVQSPMDNCADDFVDSDFNTDGLSFVVDLAEGHCCLIVDGGLYDACLNVYDPGMICCDQILCGPGVDPAPINGITPAIGAGGAIEYMWMYSLDGPTFSNGAWAGIPGTNSPNYDPGPLSETTYFARCVRAVGCDQWLETNVVEIFVDDDAVAVIEGPSSTCVDDAVTYSAPDNGSGATYEWYFGPWATPSSATGQNVDVVWNQAGIVYVTLTVNANGCASTTTYGVAISDSPVFCGTALGNPYGWGQSTAEKEGVQFSIFPNPVSDDLTVKWSTAFDTDVNVMLKSIDGRQLMSQKVDGQSLNFQADLSGFAPGIYLLEVKHGDGEREVFRVVKE